MNLLLLAIENLCRILSEYAARRREIYIEPRVFDLEIEQAWITKPPRRRP